MTFKLRAQTDGVGDPKLPYQLYRSYIDNNRGRIPESALAIIDHPGWEGGSESESPHDCHLVSFEVKDVGLPSAELTLVLMKERYSEPHFYLELTYRGLFALDIPRQETLSLNPLVWNCDEFLYFDADAEWEIKDKHFTHQVEWLGGYIWAITAREISARWRYFEHQIGEDLVDVAKRAAPVISTIGAS